METRGIGLAALALCHALVALMGKKQILSSAETSELFAGVVERLEKNPDFDADPSARLARTFIRELGKALAGGGEQKVSLPGGPLFP